MLGRPYLTGHEMARGKCLICGQGFKRVSPKQKRCRGCIKKKRNHRKAVVTKNRFYVYAWFQAGSAMPFYVGKGSGSRAWRKERGDAAVRLLREGLTEEQALLVEGVLIDVLWDVGAPLINLRRGCS